MKRFVLCLLAAMALLRVPANAASSIDYYGFLENMPGDVKSFVLTSYSGCYEMKWRDWSIVAFVDSGYCFLKLSGSSDSIWNRVGLIYRMHYYSDGNYFFFVTLPLISSTQVTISFYSQAE